MKIIDRYVLKQFIAFFFFILFALVACFIIVDFFGKIRMFLSNRASFIQIGLYFYYSIPSILAQMVPASMLLSTLITFGNFSRFNEITALKANGANIYRICLPIFLTVIAATPLNFLLSEYIAPPTRDRADYILTVEVKKQKMPGSFKQNQFWYRGVEGIYVFRLIDPKALTLRGVTFYLLDKRFQLKAIINAESAHWEDSAWKLKEVQLISLTQNDQTSIIHHHAMTAPISEKPEDFLSVRKSPDRLGFADLYRYVKKLKEDGYDTTPFRADLHGKIAFSLAGLLLIPIGLAFGLKAERSGGIAQGVTLGAVIGFSYWFVFAFFLSLGRAGTLPPWLAAWLTNLLFAGLGFLLLRRVPT